MAAKKKNSLKEIKDYDDFDVSQMIDPSKPMSFESLGLKLPDTPPTQVISIRLPTALINEIKALGSLEDVPYQALIKLMLAEGIKKKKKRA
jgi:predicted DNA binding CopG/RHH family protein